MKQPKTITYQPVVTDSESYMTGLEYEIRAEQAASLGRIGRLLESKIAELEAVQTELVGCQGPDRQHERPALIEKCLTLHKEAERYFWYMLVQRECMGIYHHESLRRHYPIPSALK